MLQASDPAGDAIRRGARQRRAAPAAARWWARASGLALLGFLLAGCSQTSRDIFREATRSRGPVDIDAQQVLASPYARIKVDGPGFSGVLVLGNDDDGRLSWYSNRRHVVFLRDGLLAGSEGLREDADEIRILGDNPFLRLAAMDDAPVKVARRYDWRTGYRYGVPVTGQLRRRGVEPVEILGTVRQLVRFEETLDGPGVRARNDYWADPDTGFIWKSRQLLAPGTHLEIVQLKPYLAPAR